jgi:hypothetical protein
VDGTRLELGRAWEGGGATSGDLVCSTLSVTLRVQGVGYTSPSSDTRDRRVERHTQHVVRVSPLPQGTTAASTVQWQPSTAGARAITCRARAGPRRQGGCSGRGTQAPMPAFSW